MSRARLERLQALAEQHDPALGRWLTAALDGWRYDGTPLERGLELCGPGARRLRDAALMRAVELLDPGHEHTHWGQAGLLARAIRRGPRQGEIGEVIAAAISSGCRIPRSPRRLRDVIEKHCQRCLG